VSPQLHRLVSQSKVGLKLFGWAAEQVVSQELGQALAAEMRALEKKPLSVKSVAEAQQSMLKRANDIDGIERLPPRRVASIPYRGHVVEVKVGSIADEVCYRPGGPSGQGLLEQGGAWPLGWHPGGVCACSCQACSWSSGGRELGGLVALWTLAPAGESSRPLA
jgi:hypothetical protein